MKKKLVLLLFFVVVTLLAVGVAIGQGSNVVVNGTFDENEDNWVEIYEGQDYTEWTDMVDHTGNNGGSVLVTQKQGGVSQTVTMEYSGTKIFEAYAGSEDPNCQVLLCVYNVPSEPSGMSCVWTAVGEEGWKWIAMGVPLPAGEYPIKVEWKGWGESCTGEAMFLDDISMSDVQDEPTPTPEPTETPTPTPPIVIGLLDIDLDFDAIMEYVNMILAGLTGLFEVMIAIALGYAVVAKLVRVWRESRA